MPKRRTVKEVDASEVQGEGAIVVISGVKVKEIRRIRTLANSEKDVDEFEMGLELVAKHIIDWNWVDDAGERLPTPKEDPSVIDELTDEEAVFLTQLLIGPGEETKN